MTLTSLRLTRRLLGHVTKVEKKTNILPRTRKVANLWGISPVHLNTQRVMFCCIYLFIYFRTVVTVGGKKKKKVFEDVPADETPLMRIVHNYRSPPAINNPLVCILHKQKQTQTIRGGWTLHKVFTSGEVMALYFSYSVTNNTKLSREKKVSPPPP